MDLNELYSRHQLSVARAAGTASVTGREVYQVCARSYAERIAQLQWRSGVVRPTVVIGA
ncbi:hypothetical protein KZ813_17580 [Sphingomonas sp. RHCKR7]|uniref:hypothetical protein n=1 Tax=Sphingomonas folli TaxID=2862497 RepID=UPI001CA47865|nr:hypothetical protein [Sphingomonas folli]MBW6528656.1 hypothetical protein [Sphingomonas folli]